MNAEQKAQIRVEDTAKKINFARKSLVADAVPRNIFNYHFVEKCITVNAVRLLP